MSDSETNGNLVGEQRGPNNATGSVEDLSEYTDADESISAPTEILAEFLSAIMLKDYETALKYCKLILHYEPNNSTAKEFYPLIMEKIELMKLQDESDDDSSSEFSDSGPSSGSNSSESESKESDSDATSASYSSLEDEEADRENNVREQVCDSLRPNDIENGNTPMPKDSVDAAGEMFALNVANRMDNMKGSGELRRKLDRVVGRASISLTENLKQSTRTVNNNNNNNNTKRGHRFPSDFAFPVKSCTNSPKREVDNVNCPPFFSSDSESPTDPTVQEAVVKDVKTCG